MIYYLKNPFNYMARFSQPIVDLLLGFPLCTNEKKLRRDMKAENKP